MIPLFVWYALFVLGAVLFLVGAFFEGRRHIRASKEENK